MGGERRTIVFMPESAYGPTNNCVGIGKVLERRGHRVVFAAEASWKGKLEPLGFEEDLVDLSPPAEGDQDAGQFWIDFVAETAPEFRKPTIEQLATFIEPVWSSLIDGAMYCHDQLAAIVDRAEPDVIVEDNVNGFPALHDPRRAVGADHVVQPARAEGPRPPTDVQRVPHGRPHRMGGVRRRGRTHPPRHLGAVQRVHGGPRRAAAPRSRVHPRVGAPQPRTSSPRRPTTRGRARPPARGIGWSPPSGRPRRPGTSPTSSRVRARSSTSRSGHSAPRTWS